MKAIKVTLPDGSVREVPEGSTAQKVAGDIGKGLEKAAIAAKVDGNVWDLNRPLPGDCKLQIITRDSKEALEVIRHSTAHLLAQAIKEIYPQAQITIGPVIDDGFYYDIDLDKKLSIEDLPAIEKKMEEIAAKKLEVTRDEWPSDKAISFFEKQGEKFKAEIIRDLGDKVVSVYTQGGFTDLCRGPHVPNTERLGKFKLLSVAGAYWRGDEKNKMLQRIYGTAFANQKDLETHLHNLEEARKRDHRRLGQDLELFTFLPIAPAMPFYLPKGTQLFNNLAGFIRKRMQVGGYQEVICPQLMTTDLWKTSGHFENYKDNMYFTDAGIEGESTMSLKPMNCPGHAALYKTSLHSYRELPLRFAELSRLHRFERAGATHGLFRARTFSQDDAHIFCMDSQVESEVMAVIRDTYEIYKMFGFDSVLVRLATQPEKSMGAKEDWDKAVKRLGTCLDQMGLKYELAEGEGAFYGPKIEFHIKDSLNRFWQCGTVQVDFNLPERFGLEYINQQGHQERPFMLHRAIFGSIERFMGVLIEHHNGHLPAWISPVQAVVIAVTDEQSSYAKELAGAMGEWGLRVETDLRNEKLGYKIREAQLKKIPWMIVAGGKEAQARQVTVRKSTGENLQPMSWEDFRKYLEPLQAPNHQPSGGSSH